MPYFAHYVTPSHEVFTRSLRAVQERAAEHEARAGFPPGKPDATVCVLVKWTYQDRAQSLARCTLRTDWTRLPREAVHAYSQHRLAWKALGSPDTFPRPACACGFPTVQGQSDACRALATSGELVP